MEAVRLDGLSVLFVDDRRDARFVVDHILRDAGAVVTLAQNGQEALEMIESCCDGGGPRPYDVVVMDVNMPVLDGLTATRRLRKSGCKVPVLALTAGAMEHDRQECLDAGCNEHLPKPINGLGLVQTVRRLCEMDSVLL